MKSVKNPKYAASLKSSAENGVNQAAQQSRDPAEHYNRQLGSPEDAAVESEGGRGDDDARIVGGANGQPAGEAEDETGDGDGAVRPAGDFLHAAAKIWRNFK